MNLFAHFQGVVASAVETLVEQGKLPAGLDLSKLTTEPPRDPSHGDVAVNAAMVLAKPAGLVPRAVADLLVPLLASNPDAAAVTVAGPGFINIKLKDVFWPRVLQAALDHADQFGASQMRGS